MEDLPDLSETAKRERALQWIKLREKHGLTDEQIAQYDIDRNRARLIAAGNAPGSSARGKHAVINLGLGPSVSAAEERFRCIEADYWAHWRAGLSGCETYERLLNDLRRGILGELRAIWAGQSSISDHWFEGECKPAIDKALSHLVKHCMKQASDEEVRCLGAEPAILSEQPAQGKDMDSSSMAEDSTIGPDKADATSQEFDGRSPTREEMSKMSAELHSSPSVRARCLKAQADLSAELHTIWKEVLPADQSRPRRTVEVFFEPFAAFAVSLYDAYAEERLRSTPSLERYQYALNFDLKFLVCDRIAPYREKPIRTINDAAEAAARGDLIDDWTVQMSESWRLFDHPHHRGLHDRVRREFLDLSNIWNALVDRLMNAVSRRVKHWLAEHAAEGALASRTPGGEAARNENKLSGAAGVGPVSNSSIMWNREKTNSQKFADPAQQGEDCSRASLIAAFISQCNEDIAVDVKILKKHIWLAAGHTHARQFQYWQASSNKATAEDDRNFRRILSTQPAEFLSLLRKKGILQGTT